jgi:hypothetical protein
MVERLKEMVSLKVQRPTYIVMDVGGVTGRPGQDERTHTEGDWCKVCSPADLADAIHILSHPECPSLDLLYRDDASILSRPESLSSE